MALKCSDEELESNLSRSNFIALSDAVENKISSEMAGPLSIETIRLPVKALPSKRSCEYGAQPIPLSMKNFPVLALFESIANFDASFLQTMVNSGSQSLKSSCSCQNTHQHFQLQKNYTVEAKKQRPHVRDLEKNVNSDRLCWLVG